MVSYNFAAIKDLIVTAMEKGDQLISIYIFPDGNVTINIVPWSESEEENNDDTKR